MKMTKAKYRRHGSYSPAPVITSDLEKKLKKIVEPTLKALKKVKSFTKVFCMYDIKNNEPYLIEYNMWDG